MNRSIIVVIFPTNHLFRVNNLVMSDGRTLLNNSRFLSILFIKKERENKTSHTSNKKRCQQHHLF